MLPQHSPTPTPPTPQQQENTWKVTDASTNGTFVRAPNEKTWARLPKGQPTPVQVGWSIRLSAPLPGKHEPLEYILESYTPRAAGFAQQPGISAVSPVISRAYPGGASASGGVGVVEGDDKKISSVVGVKRSRASLDSGKGEGGGVTARAPAPGPASPTADRNQQQQQQQGEEENGERGGDHIAAMMSIRSENEKLRNALKSAREEYGVLEATLRQLKDSTQAEIDGLKESVRGGEARERRLSEEKKELEEQVQAVQEEPTVVREKLEATEGKVREGEARVKELEEGVRAAQEAAEKEIQRAALLEAAAAAAAAALAAKDASQAHARELLEKEGGDRAALEARCAAAESEAAQLRSTLETRDTEVAEHKRRLKELNLKESDAREREQMTRVLFSEMERLAVAASRRAQDGAAMVAKLKERIDQAVALGYGGGEITAGGTEVVAASSPSPVPHSDGDGDGGGAPTRPSPRGDPRLQYPRSSQQPHANDGEAVIHGMMLGQTQIQFPLEGPAPAEEQEEDDEEVVEVEERGDEAAGAVAAGSKEEKGEEEEEEGEEEEKEKEKEEERNRRRLRLAMAETQPSRLLGIPPVIDEEDDDKEEKGEKGEAEQKEEEEKEEEKEENEREGGERGQTGEGDVQEVIELMDEDEAPQDQVPMASQQQEQQEQQDQEDQDVITVDEGGGEFVQEKEEEMADGDGDGDEDAMVDEETDNY